MAVLSAGIDRYTAVVYTISMEDPGLQVVAAALHRTYTRRIPDAYQTLHDIYGQKTGYAEAHGVYKQSARQRRADCSK